MILDNSSAVNLLHLIINIVNLVRCILDQLVHVVRPQAQPLELSAGFPGQVRHADIQVLGQNIQVIHRDPYMVQGLCNILKTEASTATASAAPAAHLLVVVPVAVKGQVRVQALLVFQRKGVILRMVKVQVQGECNHLRAFQPGNPVEPVADPDLGLRPVNVVHVHQVYVAFHKQGLLNPVLVAGGFGPQFLFRGTAGKLNGLNDPSVFGDVCRGIQVDCLLGQFQPIVSDRPKNGEYRCAVQFIGLVFHIHADGNGLWIQCFILLNPVNIVPDTVGNRPDTDKAPADIQNVRFNGALCLRVGADGIFSCLIPSTGIDCADGKPSPGIHLVVVLCDAPVKELLGSQRPGLRRSAAVLGVRRNLAVQKETDGALAFTGYLSCQRRMAPAEHPAIENLGIIVINSNKRRKRFEIIVKRMTWKQHKR